jgi:uncharacterized protein (DUF2147 family)
LLVLAGPALATPLDGDWLTEDKRGVIRVAPCGQDVCGSIVGISDWTADGQPSHDVHGASECHEVIIRVSGPDTEGKLDGTVMNPQDGKVYSARLWVGDDGVLRLHGFIGVELLGQTQQWTHSDRTVLPDCHFH